MVPLWRQQQWLIAGDTHRQEDGAEYTWLKGNGCEDAAARGARCVDEGVDLTAWTDSRPSELQSQHLAIMALFLSVHTMHGEGFSTGFSVGAAIVSIKQDVQGAPFSMLLQSVVVIQSQYFLMGEKSWRI